MGHEPDLKTKVMARLKQLNPIFNSCSFEIWPVLTELPKRSYIEYYLFGRAPQLQGKIGSGSHWIGPVPLHIDKDSRIRMCGTDSSTDKLEARVSAGEDIGLCDMCRHIQDRFVTPLPKASRTTRRKPLTLTSTT